MLLAVTANKHTHTHTHIHTTTNSAEGKIGIIHGQQAEEELPPVSQFVYSEQDCWQHDTVCSDAIVVLWKLTHDILVVHLDQRCGFVSGHKPKGVPLKALMMILIVFVFLPIYFLKVFYDFVQTAGISNIYFLKSDPSTKTDHLSARVEFSNTNACKMKIHHVAPRANMPAVSQEQKCYFSRTVHGLLFSVLSSILLCMDFGQPPWRTTMNCGFDWQVTQRKTWKSLSIQGIRAEMHLQKSDSNRISKPPPTAVWFRFMKKIFFFAVQTKINQKKKNQKTRQENKGWTKRQSCCSSTRGKCLMTCPITHKDMSKNISIYEESHLSQILQWKLKCVFLEVWQIKWKLKTNEFSEYKRNLQAPRHLKTSWSHEYIALHGPGAGSHVDRWLLIVAQLGCRTLGTCLNQTEQDREHISTGPRQTRYSGWQSVCNVSRTEWEPPRCAIPPTSLKPSR